MSKHRCSVVAPACTTLLALLRASVYFFVHFLLKISVWNMVQAVSSPVKKIFCQNILLKFFLSKIFMWRFLPWSLDLEKNYPQTRKLNFPLANCHQIFKFIPSFWDIKETNSYPSSRTRIYAQNMKKIFFNNSLKTQY